MSRYKTYSRTTVTISDIEVQVHRKNVKNLNLRVYPAKNEVKVSVPRRAPETAIHTFIENKVSWIRKHLNRVPAKKAKPKILLKTGETVFVWGKPFTLNVIRKEKSPKVYIRNDNELFLQVRPGADSSKKEQVLNEWYRNQLKASIPDLIAKWEPVMGVSVSEFGIKRMKTRWGTCNIRAKRIWLNLELSKKRPEFLEYVVVHEMVHLLERLHNKRFYSYMTQFFPQWRSLKKELNSSHHFQDC